MKSRGSTRLRLADRYVGIPLLAILGLLRRRASQLPPAVLSIGVMKTTAIGDTVLLSGALHDLAAAHPQAQLTFSSALASYENGKLDFATLLDAQRQIRQAKQSQIKAQLEAQMRLAEIEKLLGEEL